MMEAAPDERRRAVLFDLDDTLCNTTETDVLCLRAAFARLEERYPDVDRERAGAAHREIRDAYSREAQGGNASFSHARVARRLLEALGIADDGIGDAMVEVFLRVQRENLRVTPGALPTLTALRRVAKLAVVTNGPTLTQRYKLRLLELTDSFDHIAVSAELGLWKPAPGIFEATLQALGVAAEAAAMVGDIPSLDLAAAKGLGMTTVQFTGHANLPDEESVADHATDRLDAVPFLLGLL